VNELVGVMTVAWHSAPVEHDWVVMLVQLTVVARPLVVSRLSWGPCNELLNAWTLQDTCSQLWGVVAVIVTVSDSPKCSERPFSTTPPLLMLELPPGDGRETAVTANPGGGRTIAALSGFASEVSVNVTVNAFVAPGATNLGETAAV
jgi:hypothetical protein